MPRKSIVAYLTALVCVSPLAGQSSTTAFINANVIDPVLGAAMGRMVVVEDGKITYVGSDRRAAPEGATIVNLNGRYVLPGLIDAHVHIGNFASARRALRSGVTTARSMGVSHFVDIGLRELGREGSIETPEILAAGYHVRPSPADELFMDAPDMADLRGNVRGEEAMRRMARFMISRGVDFIKTNATQRAGLPETDPREPFYNEQELAALVDEAMQAGVPVAAHAHGDGGARDAVLAGVRSIEHGTYLSGETMDLMVERGTFLAPTIAVVADLTMPGGDYDNAVLNVRGRHMLPRVREMAARAHAKGVRIVSATDTGYGPESVLRLSHELMELVNVGLSPLEALRAATTTAAALLEIDDRVGQVAVGFEGDLLVLERNPLQDIGAFQDVLLVMNNGTIVVDRTEF